MSALQRLFRAQPVRRQDLTAAPACRRVRGRESRGSMALEARGSLLPAAAPRHAVPRVCEYLDRLSPVAVSTMGG